MTETFKLTYATMFNPPEELHQRYDEALVEVKKHLGEEHGMLIAGKERFSAEKFEDRSPANTDLVLGLFQKGTAQDANEAILAAEGVPHVEPDEMAGPGGIDAQGGRCHRPAHLRDQRRPIHGSGEEPHGSPGRRG